ncbi:hypothetical protein B566_EDAN003044 [Ephemera danica]|nr:hypothetical protein B566_EDAN003044 [Ephemera danica]
MRSLHVLVVLGLTLLTFALAAADHATTNRLTCNSVTPLKTLDFSKISGEWYGVKTLQFLDGHPFRPENDPTPHVCIHGHTHDITDKGFKVTMNTVVPGREVAKEEVTLSTIGDEQGQFEFLVLASEPNKYLIYLICLPPNAAGERLPSRANLLTREHSGQAAITSEEAKALEHSFGEKFGLSGSTVKPIEFNHACWPTKTDKQ